MILLKKRLQLKAVHTHYQPPTHTLTRLWDAQVLCINVHQFQLELAIPLALFRLKHEGGRVAVVVRLDRNGVIASAALQYLGHGALRVLKVRMHGTHG